MCRLWLVRIGIGECLRKLIWFLPFGREKKKDKENEYNTKVEVRKIQKENRQRLESWNKSIKWKERKGTISNDLFHFYPLLIFPLLISLQFLGDRFAHCTQDKSVDNATSFRNGTRRQCWQVHEVRPDTDSDFDSHIRLCLRFCNCCLFSLFR